MRDKPRQMGETSETTKTKETSETRETRKTRGDKPRQRVESADGLHLGAPAPTRQEEGSCT